VCVCVRACVCVGGGVRVCVFYFGPLGLQIMRGFFFFLFFVVVVFKGRLFNFP